MQVARLIDNTLGGSLAMKALFRDYIRAVGWYLVLIAGGLVVTLTVSSAVGYLPYSDRPGPGWVGPSFSLAQLGYYASWGALLLLPTAIYGTALFAYFRLLRFLHAPALLIRLVGAVGAAIVSLILAAGAGWYIAMAAFPAFVAAGLGALWGSVLLPRYLGPVGPPRSPWVRWTATTVVILAAPLAIYAQFFAPSYGQKLELNVLRLAESGRDSAGSALRGLSPKEASLLDSLFPGRGFERGTRGVSMTNSGEHQARMLVVVTGPLATEARLRVPKGASVVYIQRGDQWQLIPPGAPTLRDRIRLGPGSTRGEMTFAWPRAEATSFRWAQD